MKIFIGAFWLIFAFLCSYAYPAYGQQLPEYYGIYAVDNGKLIELKDTGLSNSTVNISSKAKFIAFNKNYQPQTISPFYYIRNQILSGPLYRGKNEISPYHKWKTLKGKTINIRTAPVNNQTDMIYLVPREPLKPGVYAIPWPGNNAAIFTVNKDLVLGNPEQSEWCVDLKVSDAFALYMGASGQAIPCNTKGTSEKMTSSPKSSTSSNPAPYNLADQDPLVQGIVGGLKNLFGLGKTSNDDNHDK